MSSEKIPSDLKSKTNEQKIYEYVNLHPMFSHTPQRRSITHYHTHHRNNREYPMQKLEEILGRFEEHYGNEIQRSLTSQLSRIAKTMELYSNPEEKLILGPLIINQGKTGKSSKSKSNKYSKGKKTTGRAEDSDDEDLPFLGASPIEEGKEIEEKMESLKITELLESKESEENLKAKSLIQNVPEENIQNLLI